MHTGKNREKGVAAVEFALILPALLVVLFMIIEFSIILYDKAVITNASREGARMGIVNAPAGLRPNADAIKQTVNDYSLSNLISFSPATPNTNVPAACVNTGDLLKVNVTYTYNFFVLPNFVYYVGGLTPGLTLTGNTVMRCE